MIIERFLLRSFEEQELKEKIVINVPEGSRFLTGILLHDGVYAVYETPELEVADTQEEAFAIIKPKQSIPIGARFQILLNVVMETKEGQGVLLFPLYKFEESKIISLSKV